MCCACGGGRTAGFLDLHYDAYSSADDSHHTPGKVRWTKLAWLNEDLLQIDALDTTYATTVAGSGKLGDLAATVAAAHGCAGPGSTRGEGVIDLRDTPYAIAGVSGTPCYQTNAAFTPSTCFQWRSSGWDSAVRVTCSDGNQRCRLQCGGYCGGCSPIDGILQLEWVAPSPPPPSPLQPPPGTFTSKADLKTAATEYDSDADAAIAKYGPIADWDVSGVTDMSNLFHNLHNFNADISGWDTSGVMDMNHMFRVRGSPRSATPYLPHVVQSSRLLALSSFCARCLHRTCAPELLAAPPASGPAARAPHRVCYLLATLLCRARTSSTSR